MSEDKYSDINGNTILLNSCSHSSFCREFTISTPKVSLRKIMAYTCSVWLIAYTVFLITENTTVLSAAIFVTLLGMMLHLHFVKIDHESLLIIGSLGIQMSSSYASGRESTTFIEMGKVKDIVINEAIYMQRVIYYLCILLKDPSDPNGVADVVPLFQLVHATSNLVAGFCMGKSSKPRLSCLDKVYKSCQEIIGQC